MALEVRRVDVETGELLMPWTTFPSQTAAARALKAQGLTDPTISRLTRGLEPHWNGFESRLGAGMRSLSRPVEVRYSLERVRERAAHERHIANQPCRSHHTL